MQLRIPLTRSSPQQLPRNSSFKPELSINMQAPMEEQYNASYIWDLSNPNKPLDALIPQSPLCSIASYNKDPHLIAGGSMNGVVYFWDTRNLAKPVRQSKAEESHRDPVWDVKWLQSKTGEVMSVSKQMATFMSGTCVKQIALQRQLCCPKIEHETIMLEPKNKRWGCKGSF